MNQPKKSQDQEKKTDFLYPPLANGVDYLSSVVELLLKHEESPNPKHLKYVVLHLQAAVEVLLKSRLQQEHWSLVFKDSNKAKRASYNSGDFQSVTPDESVRRLIEIVGIKISDGERKELNNLTKSRNALQHWGHVGSIHALEARAAKVLDFLIRFIDDDLFPELRGSVAKAVLTELDEIRDGLNKIQRFVKERLDRLGSELETIEGIQIHCPDCENFTLILHDAEGKCYFCPQEWVPHHLMDRYMESILNLSEHEIIAEGMTDPRMTCFECGMDTLLMGVTVNEEGTSTNVCFCCTQFFDDIFFCVSCEDPMRADADGTQCTNCWHREDYQPSLDFP